MRAQPVCLSPCLELLALSLLSIFLFFPLFENSQFSGRSCEKKLVEKTSQINQNEGFSQHHKIGIFCFTLHRKKLCSQRKFSDFMKAHAWFFGISHRGLWERHRYY